MIITKKFFPSGKKVIQLQPEDGYKYVTNGRVWGKLVTLGWSSNISDWFDTNEEPPEEEDNSIISEV